MQYDKITQKNANINANEARHSEMGPVRQNPIQRPVRTVHLSVLMTTQLQYTIQHVNSSDNLPYYLQTTIIAQTLSIGGEGGVERKFRIGKFEDHTPARQAANQQFEICRQRCAWMQAGSITP